MTGVEVAGGFDELFERLYADKLTQRQSARRRVIEDVGPQVVARLAMAPVWTSGIIDASRLAAPGTLHRLAEVGVAERAGDRFVVDEDAVGDALALVLRGGPKAVTAELRTVAQAVYRAHIRDVAVPPALDRFAFLVIGAESVEQVADRLIEEVTEAPDVADAVNWIAAAERLEITLGREMVGACLRAGRVVAGRRRDTDNARFLDGYFPRPALERALRAVRDGGVDDPWAVHLRAPAGQGKTWLVRWLDAGFPSDGSTGSVARVDFDYLRPTYPGTEPGLLLTLLAAQLRQFAGPAAHVRFDRLDDLVADWHARIDEAERTRPGEVLAIRAGRQGLVLRAFASAVAGLPRPVVMILDTTEELDKADGGDANVRSMIAILEAVHEHVPAVRVVLSGRRALPLPPGVEEQPIPGFDREDAARFVDWVGVAGERAEAVVERVAADAPTGDVNPFDLARLARWARDDPGLDAAAIRASDDDQYVEQRILARLAAPELNDALPVVVALGRFDTPTLGAATGLEGEALDRLAAAVASQEWVAVEPGGLLVVWPQLAARLAAYLARHRRVPWETAHAHAGATLRAYCLEAARTAITVEHVAGAIRLTDVEADRAGAEEWWARVEDRARTDGDYGWLLGITGRLLGADGAAPRGHPLHAAVLAGHAACLDREAPSLPAGRPELWRQVVDAAAPGSRPGARAAAHLPDLLPAALAAWAGRLDEALAASFVAGAEAWAELDPATAEALWHAATARDVSPELTAMAAVLAGRAHGRIGARDACRRWLDRAVEQVDASVRPRSDWVDWPVDDVATRVRLWAARTWWPSLGPPAEARNLLGDVDGVENIDQERAAGFALTLTLAQGRGGKVTRFPSPTFPARCTLHLDLPPFVVPRELALARDGDVDGAVAALEDARASYQSGSDYLAAERALMLLVRRLRLRDVGIGLTSGLADSAEIADRSLLADLDAQDGEKATEPPWRFGAPAQMPASVFHAWWRAVRAGDPEGTTVAREWPVPRVDRTSPAAAVHRALDAVELALMTSSPPPRLPAVTDWIRVHRREQEAVLRLYLRFVALGGHDSPNSRMPLIGWLGPNLAAEIALDEGESLALRLPRQAGFILDRARRWFARAGDDNGALRAATAAALAVLADRGPDGVSAALDRVESAYRSVRRPAGLPSWEQLRDRPADALTAPPRCWQPWIGRVAVLLAASGSPGEALVLRLYERFGASNVDRLALPAELATAVAAVRDRPGPSRPPTSGSTADGLPAAATLLIEGSGEGSTHITRGTFVRVTISSATGALMDVAGLDDTDPLTPYARRLQRGSPLRALTVLPPDTPVAVHHSADHGATPWEAIVTAALVQEGLEDPEPPTRTIWRRMQKADRRPPRRSPQWSVLEAMLEPVPLMWSPRIPVDRALELPFPGLVPYRVVLLVGWASEMRSGVGFALDRPGRKTAGYPRTATELGPLTTQADLVIVQGLPDYEPALADWSREQAAYLRQLGAEFALHGVPAVVVVPPCALHFPQPLADMLADTPEQLSAAGVVRAVAALRAQIRQESPAERAVEDALNVCLYLSDTLTNALT